MSGESSTENNDDDHDDPIVREIPIFHSKKLEKILHLFQYPLKRKNCSNEHRITKCFVKPHNEEFKLELGINIQSPNFDTGRAEIIAHEVDGNIENKKDKNIYFENEVVDKVFMNSVKAVSQPENYAVAAYNGREIHLTSLKGIYQFRPHFPYLEKGLKRKKDVFNKDDSDDEEAGPSTAEAVTVRFKQGEDRGKKFKDESYKAMKARSAEEPWTACRWYERESTQSNVERLKLITDHIDDVGQALNLSDAEYVKLLIPEDKEQTPLEPTLPSHVLSLHSLRALPIQEQCRLLLKDAQIIQFQQMLMLLAGGEGLTADTLLKNLQKVSVLVRGNWIVKSEVLYPSNTFSAISGVPAELMCRARDYVLYLFTKHQYVERKKVSSVMKIPSEEVKEIFTGISKLRTHNKGWELSLPTDQDFINRHQEVVQRQNLFWEHRYHQLSEFLKDNQRQRRKSKSASESDGGSKTRNNSVSLSSDNESGVENGKIKSPVVSKKIYNVLSGEGVAESDGVS